MTYQEVDILVALVITTKMQRKYSAVERKSPEREKETERESDRGGGTLRGKPCKTAMAWLNYGSQ